MSELLQWKLHTYHDGEIVGFMADKFTVRVGGWYLDGSREWRGFFEGRLNFVALSPLIAMQHCQDIIDGHASLPNKYARDYLDIFHPEPKGRVTNATFRH